MKLTERENKTMMRIQVAMKMTEAIVVKLKVNKKLKLNNLNFIL